MGFNLNFDPLGMAASIYGSVMQKKATDSTNYANMKMNQANIAMQRETNAQNLALAREQMQWQKNENDLTRSREDNAYQRAVKDAMAAGLSPLAVSQGAGAQAMQTTPAAQMQAPANSFAAVQDNSGAVLAESMSNVLSGAISRHLDIEQAELLSAQAEKTRAETESITTSNSVLLDKLNTEIEQGKQNLANMQQELAKNKELTRQEKARADQIIDELKAKLEVQVETANQIKADVANTQDLIKSREQERSMNDWNIKIANALGAPIGFVPSNAIQFGAITGLNFGRKDLSKPVDNSARDSAQEEADKAYEEDLATWTSEAKRWEKYFNERKISLKELNAWKKKNPRPNRRAYKVRRR